MKRLIPVFLLLILSAPFVWGDVTINKNQFVANRGSGYCGYCCLEMCCLNLGYMEVKGLTNRREETYVLHDNGNMTKTSGGASVDALLSELDYFKIKYRSQQMGNKSITILEKAAAEDLPATISVRHYPGYGDHHAIILTGLSKTTATIVDPNINNKSIIKSRDWLEKHWTGYTVVVEPKTKPTIVVGGPPPAKKDVPFATKSKAPDLSEYKYATPPGLGWSSTTRPSPSYVFRP